MILIIKKLQIHQLNQYSLLQLIIIITIYYSLQTLLNIIRYVSYKVVKSLKENFISWLFLMSLPMKFQKLNTQFVSKYIYILHTKFQFYIIIETK